MKIENHFTIDAPVDRAWRLLTDIPQIAPCLPGARLSDETDGVYSGSVKVKVGPVTTEYRGSARFIEQDDVNHRAVIDGKGRDTRGAGNARALITAEVRDVGDDQTRVDISTELEITGKVAQFGRGVMQDVSEKLLGQFADCLATKLQGETARGADVAASAAEERLADAGSKESGAEPNGATSIARGLEASDDGDDTLDLLDVAGGAVAKRAIPVVLVCVAVAVFLILVLA